jgi:hypothetical protein
MKEIIKKELEKVESKIADTEQRIEELQVKLSKNATDYSKINVESFINCVELDLNWIKEKYEELKQLRIQKCTLESLLFKGGE